MVSTPLLLGLLASIGSAGGAWAGEPCATGPTTLKVSTLNTWGLPYPLSRNRRSRFERIADYLGSGLDVVGLQEVWSSARWMLLHDLRVSPDARDSGLAVVTHLPSTRPELEAFRDAGGVDRLKSKGILRTRVALPDGGFTWVVVTHMQAGGSERAATIRADQVGQLLQTVEGLEGPVVLMGDFNLYDDQAHDLESTRRLESAGLVDASQTAGKARPTYPGITSRLDRIYVRSGAQIGADAVTAEVIEGAQLSDHRPVQATVELCRP